MKLVIPVLLVLAGVAMAAENPPEKPVKDSVHDAQIKRLNAFQDLIDSQEELDLLKLTLTQKLQRIESVDVLPQVTVARTKGKDRAVAQEPSPEPPSVVTESLEFSIPSTVTGNVGELIPIRAVTNAKYVEWASCNDNLTFPIPSDWLREGITGTIVSSSVPGKYKLHAYTSWNNKPSKMNLCIVTITGGVVPGPPPTPGPVEPTPPVSNPSERFGLITVTKNSVIANVPIEKRNNCAGFAANYSGIVARISSNQIKTRIEANAALKEMNTVTAGVDIDIWTKVISDIIFKLAELSGSGKLDKDNINDMRTAYAEIAAGFLSVGR